jgi:NADH dehydrogenase
MSLLPVMPISGSGRAAFQPIWAEDVADCVLAALDNPETEGRRYELAGPQTLTYRDVVRCVLEAVHRDRPILGIPVPAMRRFLNLTELLMGPTAFATWDEAELLEVPAVTPRGTADAERLGVQPKPMAAVLGT